jgi:hypothetical protein
MEAMAGLSARQAAQLLQKQRRALARRHYEIYRKLTWSRNYGHDGGRSDSEPRKVIVVPPAALPARPADFSQDRT